MPVIYRVIHLTNFTQALAFWKSMTDTFNLIRTNPPTSHYLNLPLAKGQLLETGKQ